MERQELFNKKVMRRVFIIFWFQRLSHPLSLAILFSVVSLFIISRSVSLTNIFLNLSQTENLLGLFDFCLTAFVRTRLLIQISSVVLLSAICLFVENFFQQGKQLFRQLVRVS